MTATHEIEQLQSLKFDTYFAQAFPEEVIDAMCENIRKDFPIDCGVDIFENCHPAIKAKTEAKIIRGQLDEANGTIESLREQKSEMTDLIIQLLYAGSNPTTDQEAEKFLDTYIGRKEIIKHKIKLGLKLSDIDEKWLYNNL